MSRKLVTIGRDRPLAEAHALMNARVIRHLLVLDGGQVAGLVSQRDLHLIETLRDVDPRTVLVEEAMSPDVLTATPDDSVADVARRMRLRRAGSALVLRGGKPAGIFTTTDALRALEELAAPRRPAAKQPTRGGRRRS